MYSFKYYLSESPQTLKFWILALLEVIWERSQLNFTVKGRDNTLPTKVHLVKAMVFPVVMYGCDSWTIKKAERQRIDAFEL